MRVAGDRVAQATRALARAGAAALLATTVAVAAAAQHASAQDAPAQAQAQAQAQPPAPAQPRPAQPRFAILEYRVVGNTVLPPLAVEEAVYPHLGTGRTGEDVERARAALEDAYSRAGYATVSVTVPEQSVTGGVVTFRVVERPVGRLRVVGARYFLPSQVRAEAPSMAEGTVPNLTAVQRDLAALNRSPDRRVTPELRPGAAPDTVDVDLRVEDRFPVRATIELNNRRSANTEPLRTSANLRYDNLWQRGDGISVGFQTAPERTRDATVWSGSYLFRIPGSEASLLATVVRSDSNVATVGGSSVIGKGTIYGLRGLLPLGGEAGFNHSLSLGIDRKSFEEGILQGSDRSENPITYWPVSAAWNAGWNGERTTSTASATLTAGLRGIGSDTTQFEAKRAYASASWSHLRAEGSHLYRFGNDIQVFGEVGGQASRDSLISNEQFGVGGGETVRGYLEAESLGDLGLNGQLELRSPNVAWRLGRVAEEIRVHAFLDGASLMLNRPLPEQAANASLLSTGIGARITLPRGVNGAVETAATLTEGPLTQAGTLRTLFRIWGEF